MQLKDIVLKTGFRFKKNLGQNFIEDPGVLSGIADCGDISKEDVVLEIGVGGGTLTREIASRARSVFGYEIDKSLKPVLERSLSGVENAEIIFRDFMRVPMKEAEKEEPVEDRVWYSVSQTHLKERYQWKKAQYSLPISTPPPARRCRRSCTG